MSDIVLKHAKVSAKADGPDSTLIRPSDWNAEHALSLSGPGIVGRQTAGAGPAELLLLANFAMPTGAVIPYAGPVPPSGWQFACGQLVGRTDPVYAGLFSVIGTTFGAGDGSTTFKLPDLRGMVPGGRVNMDGTDRGNLTGATTVGVNLGNENIILSIDTMPSHNHGIVDPGHSHGINASGYTGRNTGLGGVGTGGLMDPQQPAATSTDPATTGISTQAMGNGNGHYNVQPTIILNYLIKL